MEEKPYGIFNGGVNLQHLLYMYNHLQKKKKKIHSM